MKRSSVLAAGFGMLLLILDSRCAAQSARDALELCLKTVIPSLFPMFVLSGILVSFCRGASGKIMARMEGAIGLPSGGGVLFLLGILGGFPVGAQSIAQAVENRQLSRSNGEQMLGFCNNCSPAFLFGIAGSIFSPPTAALWIFLIQLETALLVAFITKFESESLSAAPEIPSASGGAIPRAIRSMATVCAWVILAGVAVGFLERWVYPMLPGIFPRIISGLAEITCGIMGLASVGEESVRFILCTGFVCFGGFSVWMQIASIASGQALSPAICFRQKTIQGILGSILAFAVLHIGPTALLILPVLMMIQKKRLEKPTHNVYNVFHKGGLDHVVP